MTVPSKKKVCYYCIFQGGSAEGQSSERDCTMWLFNWHLLYNHAAADNATTAWNCSIWKADITIACAIFISTIFGTTFCFNLKKNVHWNHKHVLCENSLKIPCLAFDILKHIYQKAISVTVTHLWAMDVYMWRAV